MIFIKVPARICFFGDHQDYLGLPVIAGTINRYIELQAEPIVDAEFQLELPDIGKSRTIPLEINRETVIPGDYLSSSMAVLAQKGFRFDKGYRVVISGNIPVNAGLSSSSALTIAWIRFLVAIQEGIKEVTDAEIGHWAYEAEVEFFDSPGGLMDQYTIAQQGLLFIDTEKGQTHRLKGSLGPLVVAESGIAKKTLDVLRNARLYQERAIAEVKTQQPTFEMSESSLNHYEAFKPYISKKYHSHWFAAIHNYEITQKAKSLLEKEENPTKSLGELMNQHQAILENQIGNTPERMIFMMNEARKAGALGAKTIGSGGGGCMVAMVTENTKAGVVEAFLRAGAKASYEVALTFPSL